MYKVVAGSGGLLQGQGDIRDSTGAVHSFLSEIHNVLCGALAVHQPSTCQDKRGWS